MSAPTTPAPHSVTLPTGEVIRSDQSPLERHNAVAKSIGANPVERAPAIVFGPQGLTPATANEYARQEARAAKAAPPPAAPAKAIVPPPSEVQIDQSAIDKLNAVWRAMTPEQREAKRATYESDLKTIFEGRKLGETVAQFEARKAGQPAQVPSEPAAVTHTPAEWEAGHKDVTDKDGWIPLTRINAKGLSAYVLPKLIEGQQYHKSIFSELANARAAGLSQEVVTNYITAQMKRDGFIK